MPELPPKAVMAAAAAIERELLSGRHYAMAEDSDEALARAALEAAAFVLADEVARKILAHMESHGPRSKRLRRAYRRHFSTAARVAAGAFSTREDDLRMAAEAVRRGNFAARQIPEVPDA